MPHQRAVHKKKHAKVAQLAATLVLTSFGGVYVAAAQFLARREPPRRLTFGESAVAALDRDNVTVEDLQWAWDRLDSVVHDSVVHPSDLRLRSENSKTTELCECGRHWFRKNVEEDWRFLKMVLFSCFLARTTQLCLPACWAFSYWNRYCWQPCRWPAVHLEPSQPGWKYYHSLNPLDNLRPSLSRGLYFGPKGAPPMSAPWNWVRISPK